MSYCTTGSGNFTNTRLTQINNYEYERYQFLSSAFSRFSYILIYLIVLLILRNSEIMPESIFGWLFVPVLAYLGIDMLYSFYSFTKRGAVNFDTYIWTFNKSAASGNGTGTSGGSGSSGGTSQLTATVQCTNSACCQSGMAWDSNIGKCTFLP
jgi:hypothetical protein